MGEVHLSSLLLQSLLGLGLLHFSLVDGSLFVLGKSSVLRQFLDLVLQVDHVFWQGRNSVNTDLTSSHALDAVLLSSLELTVVRQPEDSKGQDDSEERSQHSQTLGVLSEQVGKTHEQGRDGNEHDGDVKKRKSRPEASSTSKLTGSMERNSTHERKRVPDDDSGDVEEQVGKSDLHGQLVGQESSQDTSHGSTNVGSKGQRQHLLQSQDTHTDQGSQGRSRDRRGLDQHGNSHTDYHTNVSIDVGGLVDDTSGSTQEQLLQDMDESSQAKEQQGNTNDEDNDSRHDIVRLVSINLEEGRTLSSLLVTSNQTSVASRLGRVGRIGTVDRIEVVASSTCGNMSGNILVLDDNLFANGLNECLDRSIPGLSVLGGIVLGNSIGEVVQVSSDYL
eukprot:Nitzschia sp. Nitz4//scaffold352_size16485//12651//13823//NITZ4_008858-RA/size16485-exonerate_est2genome-gene-0.13-mRNA-1//-1//CDS//3329548903//6899//frame0